MSAVSSALAKSLPTMIETAVSKQVNGLDAKIQKQLKDVKPAAAAPKPPDAGNAAAELERIFKEREDEMNERMQKLENERAAERAESQRKEQEAEIKSALADFQWKEAEGKNIAFDYYNGKVKRSEDGGLTINDIPAARYIKEHGGKYFKNYHVPRDVGGSGAGGSKNGGAGSPDIMSRVSNPKMTRSEARTVQAELAELFKQAMS